MAKGSEAGGCLNCYAARMAARNLPELRSPTTGEPYAVMRESGPRWTGRVELIPSKLDEPLRWRKPRRVFVNSMSDLFHEALSNEDIERVFARMALAQEHTFQVLTKRPARMLDWFRSGVPGLETREEDVARAAAHAGGIAWDGRGSDRWAYPPGCGDVSNRRVWPGWPLPNVWLGVSVEDQATADERIPLLLQVPAAKRFVSYEPALGPVDLRPWLPFTDPVYPHGLLGTGRPEDNLTWVIVGGESGPGARPFDLTWARSVVAQCKAAGVAAFYKQGGASNSCAHSAKGGHFECFPQDLKVREFPG
jgi:protein gp37